MASDVSTAAELDAVRAVKEDSELDLLRERLELLDAQRSLAAVKCQRFTNMMELALTSNNGGGSEQGGSRKEHREERGDWSHVSMNIRQPAHASSSRNRRGSLDAGTAGAIHVAAGQRSLTRNESGKSFSRSRRSSLDRGAEAPLSEYLDCFAGPHPRRSRCPSLEEDLQAAVYYGDERGTESGTETGDESSGSQGSGSSRVSASRQGGLASASFNRERRSLTDSRALTKGSFHHGGVPFPRSSTVTPSRGARHPGGVYSNDPRGASPGGLSRTLPGALPESHQGAPQQEWTWLVEEQWQGQKTGRAPKTGRASLDLALYVAVSLGGPGKGQGVADDAETSEASDAGEFLQGYAGRGKAKGRGRASLDLPRGGLPSSGTPLASLAAITAGNGVSSGTETEAETSDASSDETFLASRSVHGLRGSLTQGRTLKGDKAQGPGSKSMPARGTARGPQVPPGHDGTATGGGALWSLRQHHLLLRTTAAGGDKTGHQPPGNGASLSFFRK